MAPQDLLAEQLGCEPLGVVVHIVVHQVVQIHLVLRYQHGLSVRIESGPSSTTAHLLYLHHRQRNVPCVGVEAGGVADDHPSGREVYPCGECGRRYYAFDPALAEAVLYEPPLPVSEAGVMECGSALHTLGQLPSRRGGLGIAFQDVLLGGSQALANHARQRLAELYSQSLGGTAAVDEHDALAAFFYRLLHKAPDLVLALRVDCLPAAVAEGYLASEIGAFLERDGTPVASDEIGMEPCGQVVGVGYRRGQRDDLEVAVPAHELGEGHLQGGASPSVVYHVDLVRYHEPDVAYPVASMAYHGVRLLGGGHDHVGIGKAPVLGIEVSGAQMDLHPEVREPVQVVLLLRCQSFQRNDVQDLAPVGDYRLESRDIADEGLPAGRRDRGDQVPPFQSQGDSLRLGRMELHEALGVEGPYDALWNVQFVYSHSNPAISLRNR